MAQSGLATVLADQVELNDDPIEPSWVLSGAPHARSAQWTQSLDATATSHVWDCTAGRFRWYFPVDETVHIIDGSVTVAVDGHDTVTLNPGDAALFHAGTWAVWDVPEYVRKHAVLRTHIPRPMALGARAYHKIRRTLGRQETAGGLG